MGGERVEISTEELDRWADRRAAELDVDRAEVVDRALAAYRLLEAEGDSPPAGAADFDAELNDFDAELDELGDRVSKLEVDLDAKVTDLRERVIQVKREADAKAPKDHEHAGSDASASAAPSDDAVSEVGRSVSTLESRVEAGFENYEGILEHLVDAAEETEERLDAVASAVVDLRGRLAETDRADAERAAAAELKREANREGVADADCEACGESVSVALLETPYCPHCGETFDGVRGKRGFLPFGSATLATGRRPALERAGTEDPPSAFARSERADDANEGDGADESDEADSGREAVESGEPETPPASDEPSESDGSPGVAPASEPGGD